jgi:hypothetical protein
VVGGGATVVAVPETGAGTGAVTGADVDGSGELSLATVTEFGVAGAEVAGAEPRGAAVMGDDGADASVGVVEPGVGAATTPTGADLPIETVMPSVDGSTTPSGTTAGAPPLRATSRGTSVGRVLTITGSSTVTTLWTTTGSAVAPEPAPPPSPRMGAPPTAAKATTAIARLVPLTTEATRAVRRSISRLPSPIAVVASIGLVRSKVTRRVPQPGLVGARGSVLSSASPPRTWSPHRRLEEDLRF